MPRFQSDRREVSESDPSAHRFQSDQFAADLHRAIFHAVPDGIFVVDEQGTIREVNDQGLKIFGYEPGELEGCNVDILVPESARSNHQRQRDTFARNPRPRPMGVGMELTGVRKDRSRLPVEISLSPLQGPGDGLVIAIVRDLTDRRRLKDFGAGSLRATEEERRRIARELHDETAQALSALLMRLSLLERRLDGHGEAREIAGVREAVHEAVEGVRRMARGLRPPELEDLGLAAALRSHVRERYLPDGKVEMSFDGSEGQLGAEQRLVAYRIVQEALANAARHSGAERVRVELQASEDGEAVILMVSDDGRGFDLESAGQAGAGLGLMGMEERAQIVDGRFEIDSRPGAGTRVRVRIPVGESALQ